MARRRPAPVTLVAAPAADPLAERRALAFARVWPLLSTTIPTSEILESYLADVTE